MSKKDPMNDKQLAGLLDRLRRSGYTVTTVESCTGGMIAARITDIPGSSDVLKEAFVTYCGQAKHEMTGVRKKTLKKYTEVSEQTAREMAEGGARAAGADLCISATGYAGPASGDDDSDCGLVYIGCCFRGKTQVKEFHFSGSRRQVRESAVTEGLLLAEAMVSKDPGRKTEEKPKKDGKKKDRKSDGKENKKEEEKQEKKADKKSDVKAEKKADKKKKEKAGKKASEKEEKKSTKKDSDLEVKKESKKKDSSDAVMPEKVNAESIWDDIPAAEDTGAEKKKETAPRSGKEKGSAPGTGRAKRTVKKKAE